MFNIRYKPLLQSTALGLIKPQPIMSTSTSTASASLTGNDIMTLEKIIKLKDMMKRRPEHKIADEIVFGLDAYVWFKQNMPKHMVATTAAGQSINSFSGMRISESAEIPRNHIELRSNGDVVGVTVVHLNGRMGDETLTNQT